MMELPEWLATMVGRLTIENEALRRALAERQQKAEAETEDNPDGL